MTAVQFVCHMAVLSEEHAPNSIAAIRECFDAGVERIEIDVHSLAGDDYIVTHDRRLENETTGAGAMGRVTPDDVRGCRFRDRPDDRPALLSEVVDAARESRTEIQLDLKDWRVMSDDRVRALDDVIATIRDRVIVSTGQDWNLQRLGEQAPDVAIGFDPGHYIARPKDDDESVLPRTLGAYGYLDDHPLALARSSETAGYLQQRFEMLLLQAQGSREWFISHRLASMMLDDGFNAAAFLKAHRIDANVWTPDYRGAESVVSLRRLIDAGFDRVTTNTTLAWQRALGREASGAAR